MGIDREHYDIYVAFSRPQLPGDPIHWLILTIHPGEDRCTWFHCEGWPGYRRTAIEAGKRFDSWGIGSKVFISRIPATAGPIVEEQARAIPPQSCRYWVLYLLLRIEKQVLVPAGTYEHWRSTHGAPSDEDFGPGSLSDHDSE